MTDRTLSTAAFAVLGILSGIGALSIDGYLPAFPAIARDLEVAEREIQLTLSAFLVSFAVGQGIYGPLSDAVGRRPVILTGLAVYAGASLMCALSPSAEQLTAFRAVQALAAASAPVLSRAVVRDVYSGPRLARAMSMLMLILSIAPLVAPALGSAILGLFGWRAIFVGLSLFALLWCALTAALVPETHPRQHRFPLRVGSVVSAFATVLGHRQAMGYVLCGALTFAGMFAYITATPFIYGREYGVSPAGYAGLFALTIVCAAVVAVGNGRLVARFGSDRLLAWQTVVLVVAAAVLLASAATGFGGLWGLVVPLVFYVGNITAVAANSIAGALKPFPRMAGTASSVFGVCQFGLGGLTSWAVAALGGGSAIAMALVILACALLAFASRVVLAR